MTEFQGFFDQIKQQDAARTATQLRLNPLQPDQAAEGLGVARELGLPAGQVMAFPELFKDKLAAQKATTALTKAPKLSDWLRSDPVHGALAKDDIENLSWFEQGFNDFRAMGGAMIDSQVGRGLQTGAKGAQQMAVGAATLPIAGMQATMLERIDAYERAAQLDPATPRHEIAAALGIDPMSPTAGLVADFVAGDADRRAWHIERAAKVITSNEETMATLTGKIREYEEEMKATQGRVPNFTDIDDIKGFGDWLGFNLGQAAPYLLATATAGAVGGPAGMLGVGYGMGVGDIRSEQITSGQDPFDQRAAAAAAVGGVPYAGIELLGAAARPFRNVGGEVLEQVAEAWAKRVGKETGLSAVEEFINEAGQEIIKDFSVWAGGGEAVELNNETLLKWFNSGMAGLATGATVGGGRTALTIAAEKDVERAAQAGSAARLLDQVSQGAAATKLKERAPDQFKAALDQAGRGDDLVYLPAAGLREFFQAKDVDFSAEVAEMWGIDLNTMAQMELSGGRVGVPISNFAAYVAGTDAEAWVRENATLDPDEVSLADAAAFNDQVQDQLTAAYEQEAAEARADLERRSSDQQVFDGVYSQLREAGRTADVAEKEARVFGAFFRTMADRVGDDALDLARRFGLRIQGPDAPGLPRRRGQLDVMLNDLRSGRKEKTGRSLVQFIIDEGGVQDTGGDVAALEGPKGLVAETREEILARQSQPSLDGMPSTGRGLQLDELGRKAVELGYFPELMGEVAGLNDGEAADLGRAVLEALGEEMSGRPRYLEGEGPDPARAALNDALQERGIDPAAMTNDEIAAALETVQEGEFAQSAPVESEAFRAWFGDSKVVDAEGKPLVVYHGAPDVRDILASGFKKSPTRGGVYFTSDKQSVANTYADDSRALDYQNAEPHVIPLYMSLQNPLVIDAKGQKWRETEKHIQEARDGGHDGLIIKNSRDEYNNTKDGGAISTVYVAFEPTQMKSAMTQNLRSRVDRIDIGGGPNRGTFDPADPRILYQEKRGSIQLPRGGIASGETEMDVRVTALETVQEREFAQSPPVESEAFKAWFGDSKVVDAQSKPLVVYHGSAKKIGKTFEFSEAKIGSANDDGFFGRGFYLTQDKRMAEGYASDKPERIIEAYVSLQNPLIWDDSSASQIAETQARLSAAGIEGFEVSGGGLGSQDARAFSNALRAAGFDGIIVQDTWGGSAPFMSQIIAFSPTQIKSVNNRGTFDPTDPRILYQEKRGSIQLPRGGIASGETIINLFENADLSTVIHEAGHFFLEAMNDLASQPGAPQQLRDDMDAVRKFIGAEEGKAIETEAHETFARALEAYFLEGKAPSLALGDVFARAKAWLLRIYRGISGLNVKMNAEIREVFDRMLATDAEIDAARAEASADPLFREKPAGMSDADWATYQRMARRSAQDAEDRLREKVMEKVRREKQAWWKAERKALRAEVEARMNTEPRFRLVEAMANGRILTPEGERAAPDVRIDRATLVEQFGDGVLAEVSRTRLGGKRAIYGEDGMTPAEAAEMFGFPGASEMVSQLQNTGKRQDEIAAEVDRIMLDRYGDVLHDGTIEAAALDAIHNAHMEQKNVTEARQIAKQLGRDTRSMTPALYKQRARLMLGRMTVREASAPARFLAAERKAGRDAERAFAKVARGDAGALALALQAKEQQILNAALFDLSRQVEKDVSRAREKAQDYGKKSIRQKLEGGYIEQIDDLLDRYDFRKRGPGAVQKSERLREFMDRMIADGREAELMIDPRMMDDARRVHYSRLSLDEFRGLMDTIANLDHLGRLKQSLINGRKQRDLQITAEAVADAVAKNLGTGRAKQESKLRYALDLVFTADTMMIDIDGGDEFGTSYQAIKEDIDQAYVRVDEMNRELAEKLDGLFSVYSAKDMREMKKERAIPGTRFVWSKWQAISVALNTGNDANMSRLLAEDAHPTQRMTREDLDAVLATLDKRDWDFVQSMWDQINSYWPQIEAVTQRRTGVKPAKVEARQVLTPFGAYPGGYYPIKYDPGLGARAAVDAKTETDNFMSAGRFAKAQTKSGHTKERLANGNGRTVMLDMSVAFSHMRDVVRDIALSEAVDNAHRVLNHNEVTQSFIEAGRKNDHDVLNLWLKDVAQGPIVHTDPINTFARFIKTNFTLSRLALNLKTVLLQVTGVAQSAVVVGRKPMAHAFADYLKRPQETVAEVMAASEFMRRRQTTFDKDIQDFATDTLDTSPMRGRMAKALDGAARFGFAPMIKTQFYAVDVPTWVAGYRAGLKRFDGDAERAVSFADRMVARAQDSGAMPDRTAVSRGTLSENVRQVEFVRLFTTLQGYMLAKFNRGYVETRRGVREVRAAETRAQQFGAAADMAANLMMLYVAEGAMMGLLYAAMAAGDDEDDEITREKFALWLAGETFGTVIGGFPLARDAWTGFSEFGDTGGVLGSALAIPSEIYKQVVQGENDRGLRRAVGDAVGMATGLPTVATLRPIEELLDEDGGSIMGALLGFNPLTN